MSDENASTNATTVDGSMSKGRIYFIYGLCIVLIVGHVIDNVTVSEHWPFSRYQMYSFMPKMKMYGQLELCGVTKTGEEVRIVAEEHLSPFNTPRLTFGILRTVRSEEKFAAASQNIAYLYELARRRGDHDSPPIERLRYYKLKWPLDPWARNVDQPVVRKLIREVSFHAK